MKKVLAFSLVLLAILVVVLFSTRPAVLPSHEDELASSASEAALGDTSAPSPSPEARFVRIEDPEFRISVETQDGVPVLGASVLLVTDEATLSAVGKTDRAGRVHYEPTPSLTAVVALHPEFGPACEYIEQPASPNTTVVVKNFQTVTFQVKEPDGDPVQCDVSLTSELERDIEFVTESLASPFRPTRTKATDANGWVSFDCLEGQVYRAETSSQDHLDASNVFVAEESAHVQLDVYPIIIGAFELPTHRSKPFDCYFYSNTESEKYELGSPSWSHKVSDVREDLDAIFGTEGVRWFVGIQKSAFGETLSVPVSVGLRSFTKTGGRTFDVPFRKIGDFDRSDIVVLDGLSQDLGTIELVFLGEDGELASPRAPWYVFDSVFQKFPLATASQTRQSTVLRELRNGIWELTLPSGNYVLKSEDRRFGTSGFGEFETTELEVRSDEESTVSVQLASGLTGDLRVRVTSPFGRPLRGWAIEIEAVVSSRLAPVRIRGPIDSGGVLVVQSLPLGKYWVSVVGIDCRSKELSEIVEVNASSIAELGFELERW